MKCQLFKTEFHYMGNIIFIKDKKLASNLLKVGSKPYKITPPMTPKGCRSFGGMVNFLSMFCLELQKLLKTNI